MLKKFLFMFGSALSLLLLWFAVSDYRAAAPIAAENLRGLAFTLSAAIENATLRDPSFRSLAGFHPSDVAFFAIIDRNGTIRYHTNPDLIGTPAADTGALKAVAKGSIVETRVVLGTGERAYEFDTPLRIRGEVLTLRLTLHTYRSDAVIRRARLNLALLLSLAVVAWVMAIVLYRFVQREEMHRIEMAQRDALARLGEMGALLAHEIRNPLAGIKGYAQVIEKRPLDARNDTFAHGIVTEVVRLEALVSDLLAYVRSDRYAMATVDLRELIDHTIALVRGEADRLSVAITNDCPEGLGVSGNRDRLVQMVLNLARNALQAMADGGSLGFSAARVGRNVTLSVSDTGQGIDREALGQVFEPFFTTRARGTGLGLALCKKIVEEHRGTIGIESRVGQGTTVTITLPMAQ